MAGEHQPAVPAALEQIVEGLGEMETAVGSAARAVIPAVRARLVEAMGARDRGDPIAAMRAIGVAMEQMAGLADQLDSREGMLMRFVAERFRTALLRGDMPEVKQGLDVMFDRAGARERKKGG